MYLRLDVGGWEYLAEFWKNGSRDECFELHKSLGGDLSLFENLETFLAKPDKFETELFKNERTRAFEFTQIDTSEQHVRFRNYIQHIIENPDLLPEHPRDMGPWDNYARVTVAAQVKHLLREKKIQPRDTFQYFFNAFDIVHPIDAAIHIYWPIDSTKQFTTASDPHSNIESIVAHLSRLDPDVQRPSLIKNDPIYRIARVLGEAVSSYGGVEHMEVAAVFDLKYSDGLRSYQCLVNAAYWSARAFGFPFPQSYQAARGLALKYGWEEMSEALELNYFEIEEQ
jgi:hypothetical protein